MGVNKRKNVSVCNTNGFGLIEALVGLAIIGVSTMAMTTAIVNMSRENAALNEKLTALATETDLVRLMSGKDLCTCLVKNATYNGNKKVADLNSSTIPVGYDKNCVPSKAKTLTEGKPIGSTNLLVNEISLENIKSGASGSGQYQGELTVSFDSKKMIRAIQSIKVPISFYVDTTDPVAKQKIQGCGAAPSPDEDGPTSGLELSIDGKDNKGSKLVKLPKGKFTKPPLVMIQPRWARYSSDEGTSWWVDEVTTTSFKINWKGPNGGKKNGDPGVYWVAHNSP